MIRAVIFDMYETLVTLTRGVQCFSGDMAAMAGQRGEALHAFRAAWRATEDARMTGLPVEDALRHTMEATGCLDTAVYGRILLARYASRRILPENMHPDILPMLDVLRARGLQVGLVTNCQSDEEAAIRDSGLMECFDVPVFSFSAGVMKPDPAIFRLCLEGLHLSPAECLYVGDGGSRELQAASALGMRALQAAWYLPAGEKVAGFVALAHPMDLLSHLDEN